MTNLSVNVMEDHPKLDSGRRPRVLFLNRSYWPDGEATGQLLTELAEDLAERFDVTVIAGQPNSNPSKERFNYWQTESRNDVTILRVPHSRFPKRWLPGRIVNFITFLALATIRGLSCKRQDIVIVETDPFLLSVIGLALRIRHRAAFVVYLQDIHPDLGIAIGKLRETWITRLLRSILAASYRVAHHVVVLSEDMRRTVRSYGVRDEAVSCIPNWIDTQQVRPAPSDSRFFAEVTENSFIVMYSGNLGVTQELGRLIETADLLRDRVDIQFMIVGNGSAEADLRKQVLDRRLKNITFLPFQPKSALSSSLSAADLHIVTVHPAALNYLMPSKLYGILAVGRPVLAAAPQNSELAQLILKNDLGFVVEPNDVDGMAAAIRSAIEQKVQLTAAGERARTLAVSYFDRKIVTRRFGDLLDEILSGSSPRTGIPTAASSY